MSNGFNLQITRCNGFRFSAEKMGQTQYHLRSIIICETNGRVPDRPSVRTQLGSFSTGIDKKLQYNTKRAQTGHSLLDFCSSRSVIYGNGYQVVGTRCRGGLCWPGWGGARSGDPTRVPSAAAPSWRCPDPGVCCPFLRNQPAASIPNLNPVITYPVQPCTMSQQFFYCVISFIFLTSCHREIP